MILIALGANLPSRYGPPENTFEAAISAIAQGGVRTLKVSNIYSTAPVPASDQPWYKNAVISVETDLTAPELLDFLKSTERDFGRTETARNEPRLLDLDLIAYDDQIIASPDIHIPHPRLEGRGFVLYPLRDVAPNWRHPVHGKTLAEMIAALDAFEHTEKSKDIK